MFSEIEIEKTKHFLIKFIPKMVSNVDFVDLLTEEIQYSGRYVIKLKYKGDVYMDELESMKIYHELQKVMSFYDSNITGLSVHFV